MAKPSTDRHTLKDNLAGLAKAAKALSSAKTISWQEMSWASRFSIGCVAGVAAFLPLGWIGFGSLGLSAAGAFALTLGITLTVALGIGLMGLVFYSNRSGRDEAVGANLGEQRGK